MGNSRSSSKSVTSFMVQKEFGGFVSYSDEPVNINYLYKMQNKPTNCHT